MKWWILVVIGIGWIWVCWPSICAVGGFIVAVAGAVEIYIEEREDMENIRKYERRGP